MVTVKDNFMEGHTFFGDHDDPKPTGTDMIDGRKPEQGDIFWEVDTGDGFIYRKSNQSWEDLI